MILFFVAVSASASEPLETETARVMAPGAVKIEAVSEFQTSKEGTEQAFPFVFEFGLSHHTEIAIEPVVGTSIRPKIGPRASGAGDIEVTLTHLFAAESGGFPALAGAFEVKFPTARNRLIGTGKTDFAGYLIASRRFDRNDLHGNLGYTVVGKPAGTHLSNIINYAIADEFHMSPRFDIVGELVGNTSSTGDKAEISPGVNVPAEATTAETSILGGVRYYLRPGLFVALGVVYDNNHASMIRTGITYKFGGH
jgi:outer membrane putative beta-barrel porin/alpha-amylase